MKSIMQNIIREVYKILASTTIECNLILMCPYQLCLINSVDVLSNYCSRAFDVAIVLCFSNDFDYILQVTLIEF